MPQPEEILFGIISISVGIVFIFPPVIAEYMRYTTKGEGIKDISDVMIGLLFSVVLLIYSTIRSDFAVIIISSMIFVANISYLILRYNYKTNKVHHHTTSYVDFRDINYDIDIGSHLDDSSSSVV
jgi:hypothetical protein